MKEKIRFAWTSVTTIMYTIILGIPIILLAPFSKNRVPSYYLGVFWSWLIMKTNRVKLKIIGVENLIKNKSYVFISNHMSNLDTPAVAVKLPNQLRFVAKSSLAKIPIFGWASRLAKMIYIDRSNSDNAIETLNRTMKELKNGISAYFFAEGTRGIAGKLKPFKKGGFMFAIKAKLPIVPLTIVGSDELLPKGKVGIKSGVMKIIVGEPIDTSGFTEHDRDVLIQKVQEIIRNNLLIYRTSFQ